MFTKQDEDSILKEVQVTTTNLTRSLLFSCTKVRRYSQVSKNVDVTDLFQVESDSNDPSLPPSPSADVVATLAVIYSMCRGLRCSTKPTLTLTSNLVACHASTLPTSTDPSPSSEAPLGQTSGGTR